MTAFFCNLHRQIDKLGDWIALLPLRVFVGYEFLSAGIEKFNGKNWFASIQKNFPPPFNWLPVEVNWFIATYAELIAGTLLIIGLATRFSAATLFILTIVAWLGFHNGPNCGFTFSGCGYKYTFIFLLMLLPFILKGSGKPGVDYFLKKKFCN